MEQKTHLLINTAKQKMAASRDLMHNLGHAKRVVNFTEQICREFSLTEKQRQALVLAAWWHDVGRAAKRKPSYIWINFFDDMISACCLLSRAIRSGLYNRTVGLAVRVIVCKNLATSALLTKILLYKKDRLLVNIIKDADYLDLLSPERSMTAHKIIENSRRYRLAYRFLNWWFFVGKRLKFKTKTAQQILKKLLEQFISWVKSAEIFNWHVKYFGYEWLVRALRRAEKKNYKLQCAI